MTWDILGLFWPTKFGLRWLALGARVITSMGVLSMGDLHRFTIQFMAFYDIYIYVYICIYIYVYCHFIGKLNQWIYLDLRDRIWSDMIFLRLTGACLWDTCSTGSSLACQWKPQLGTWGVSANDNMLPIATLNTLLSFVK